MTKGASAKPVVTMIAGPNGSGKSTLTRYLRELGVDLGEYINADEIDQTLHGPPGEERSKRAQDLANEQRMDCLRRSVSFTFETVMSHPSKIEFLLEARERGYAVVIYFVSLEHPTLNVDRVRARVELGGHPVPEDRIVSRYHRCMHLLPSAISVSDRTVLFDNSYRRKGAKNVLMRAFCETRREVTDDGVEIQSYRRPSGAEFRSFVFLFLQGVPQWAETLVREGAQRERMLRNPSKALSLGKSLARRFGLPSAGGSEIAD